MPKLVVKNDTLAPSPSLAATTLFTKSDGVWVVLADGTVYGPLGVGLGGPAGGDLTGSYPNPTIANNAVTTNKILNGAITGPKINSSLIDPAANVAGLRTLGTGALQAAAGNDIRFSNPTSGDLTGIQPNLTVAKIQGKVFDLVAPPAINSVLTWNGTKFVAAPGAGSLPGGDLSGTIPAALVVGIQGVPVLAAPPVGGDVLTFNGAQWVPVAPTTGGSGKVVQSDAFAWNHSGLLTVGQVVRVSGADTIGIPNPTSLALTTPLVGIITAVSGATATVAYYGEIPWMPPLAPLVPGSAYYLNTTDLVPAGAITTALPSGGAGTVSCRIGYAKNATTLVIAPNDPIAL